METTTRKEKEDEFVSTEDQIISTLDQSDPSICCQCIEESTKIQNITGCAIDPQCQQIICDFDEFCCSTLWDKTCTFYASEHCANTRWNGLSPPSTTPGTEQDSLWSMVWKFALIVFVFVAVVIFCCCSSCYIVKKLCLKRKKRRISTNRTTKTNESTLTAVKVKDDEPENKETTEPILCDDTKENEEEEPEDEDQEKQLMPKRKRKCSKNKRSKKGTKSKKKRNKIEDDEDRNNKKKRKKKKNKRKKIKVEDDEDDDEMPVFDGVKVVKGRHTRDRSMTL